MNDEDRELVAVILWEIQQGDADGVTMRKAMEHLLFARHLIDTLLRQMQDS